MSIIGNPIIVGGGGGSSPRLPSAYQEVEYIQTDGNAYIDTGYHFTTDCIWHLKVYRPSTAYQWNLMGVREGSDARQMYIRGAQNLNIAFVGTKTNGTYALGGNYPSSTTDKWFELMVRFSSTAGNSGMIDIPNVMGWYSVSGQSAVTFENSLLFLAINNNGTIDKSAGNRGAFLKIYDGSSYTLVRDFVPCYRKSDSVIGMYDLVNDVFYTNAGSGSFTKGNDV